MSRFRSKRMGTTTVGVGIMTRIMILMSFILLSNLAWSKSHSRRTQMKKIETYSSMVAEDSPSRPDSETPVVTNLYDEVPEAQAAIIAKRLQIAEQIILQHHRAYDYRSLTLKQLREIHEKLDRDAQVFAPPVEAVR